MYPSLNYLNNILRYNKSIIIQQVNSKDINYFILMLFDS